MFNFSKAYIILLCAEIYYLYTSLINLACQYIIRLISDKYLPNINLSAVSANGSKILYINEIYVNKKISNRAKIILWLIWEIEDKNKWRLYISNLSKFFDDCQHIKIKYTTYLLPAGKINKEDTKSMVATNNKWHYDTTRELIPFGEIIF